MKKMKPGRWPRKLREILGRDPIALVLILTTWFKLIYLGQIINDWPVLGVFLVFSLATSILVFSPVILLGKGRTYVLLAFSFVISLSLWVNTVYFRFFGSLVRLESLAIAGQTTGVLDAIVALMHPSDLLYFIDLLIVLFVVFFLKRRPMVWGSFKERSAAFLFLVIVSLSVISVVLYSDRGEHLDKFVYKNFDINQIEKRYGALGVFGINSYRYLFASNRKIDPEREAEVVDWIEQEKTSWAENKFTGLAEGKNVFLIQLESTQGFVVGKKFEGREITPNLNRLIETSYYFPNGHYMIGGGKTSDSDFSTNTSLYPLPEASVFVQHGRHDFTGLPKVLKKEGYSSYAYHAYRRDFWNRGRALNSLGFDHFYAVDEYPEGERIIMGLNDEDFYTESLRKIKEKEEPSYHYLLSLSCHYPFEMAPKFRFLPGDAEDHDYRTYHYYQAVHYSDYALGKFIDGLKEEGLYEDSLLIVYGDHSAKIGELNDPKTLETLGIEKMGDKEIYDLQKVPFVLKLPGQKEGFLRKEVLSQIDLAPTILNLLGIEGDYPMFGRDVFGSSASRFFSVVSDLPYLTVSEDFVFFRNPLSSKERCYRVVDGWENRPQSDCDDLLEEKNLQQGYIWDLVSHNLFHYFYK